MAKNQEANATDQEANPKLPQEIQEALKWYQEAQIMWNQGRSLDALSRFEAALDIFQKHHYHKEAANAAEKIGDILFWRDNTQKALKPYKLALDICEEYGDEISTAILCEKIVFVLKKLNDPERALPYLYRCLEIAEKYGDAHRAARALVGIGDVNRHRKQYDVALEAYQLAEKIYREMGSKEQAQLIADSLASLRKEMDAREDAPDGVAQRNS